MEQKTITKANKILHDLNFDKHRSTTQIVAEGLQEYADEQCNIANVVKSLPVQDLPKCNRVEVIDQQGRTYVNRNPANKISLSVQDEGRTLKVFID